MARRPSLYKTTLDLLTAPSKSRSEQAASVERYSWTGSRRPGGSGAGAASGTDRGARRLHRSMRAAPPAAAVGGEERWFTWIWDLRHVPLVSSGGTAATTTTFTEESRN